MSLLPSPTNPPFEMTVGTSKKGGYPVTRVIWTGQDGFVHKIEYKQKTRLSATNKARDVAVQIGENEFAVFNKKDLKKFGPSGTLKDTAREALLLIKQARAAVKEGVWSSPTADRDEPPRVSLATTSADILAQRKERYKALVMSSNLGSIDNATRQALANRVADLATTGLPAQMLALSEGVKPRIPPNPRKAIEEVFYSKGSRAAKAASIEPSIAKVRTNKQGEIIVSLELPIAEGGSKTVRRKLELNLTQETINVVAYSRVLKYMPESSITREIRQELAREAGVSLEFQAAGIEESLSLTPKVNAMGEVKGYESPISEEGSAEGLIKEPIPAGERRYSGERLLRNITVGHDLMKFLKIIHDPKMHKVHQDIKPLNILVFERPDGGVHGVVMDYGTVRDVEGKKEEGSPLYLGPEDKGQPKATTTRDCYSAGITLKQLVYGPNAKVNATGDAPEEILQDLAPEGEDLIDDVIRGLCNPDPSKRMTAAEAEEKLEILRFFFENR